MWELINKSVKLQKIQKQGTTYYAKGKQEMISFYKCHKIYRNKFKKEHQRYILWDYKIKILKIERGTNAWGYSMVGIHS